MSALTKTSPFLMAAVLIAGALACSKPKLAPPAPAPQAAPAATPGVSAQPAADDQQPKADAAAEAARKAAAMQEAEYQQAAAAALQDVHFAFDQSAVMESDKPVLVAIAGFMKAYPKASLLVDGNCDERGTVEYNLALGTRRAQAAMDYLMGLGVPAARLGTTSYGKEKPVCTESVESCWSRNRRAHFSLK